MIENTDTVFSNGNRYWHLNGEELTEAQSKERMKTAK